MKPEVCGFYKISAGHLKFLKFNNEIIFSASHSCSGKCLKAELLTRLPVLELSSRNIDIISINRLIINVKLVPSLEKCSIPRLSCQATITTVNRSCNIWHSSQDLPNLWRLQFYQVIEFLLWIKQYLWYYPGAETSDGRLSIGQFWDRTIFGNK